jgi:alanine racemase
VTNRPAWAEISLANVAHNMQELRRVTQKNARMMAVVKAHAYGHGAVPVSRTALANGADYLGVAIVAEAQELRIAGIDAPILVLGYTPPEQAPEAIELNLAQTVYTMEAAEAISMAAVKLRKKAKIHIKIDTGMGRLGFLTDLKTPSEILKIAGLPGLDIEGLFTHFAVADAREKSFTREQYEKFLEVSSEIEKFGLEIPIKHAANSAAIIDLPDMHLDMVRAGVSIYGLYPSEEVMKDKIDLKPALSLKARVSYVKKVKAGTGVSYGRTFITDRDTTIATIPVGYADGYTRLLSHKAMVIIRGQKVPVLGTVCMDQFMVDVTAVPDVKIGDEVVLIGQQGGQSITADELARLIGTINYEIVCMISDRVPRIYV